MKSVLAFLLLAAPCVLSAQILVLPPGSSFDGVFTHHEDKNKGKTHWDNPSTLGAYKISGRGYAPSLDPRTVDSRLGLRWTTSAPTAVSNLLQTLNQSGGILRVIFLGESAGWKNDFGYTYSGSVQGPGSYTVWKNIQSDGGFGNIHYGDYFDVTFSSGDLETFDLWFNTGDGHFRQHRSQGSGVYTLFHNPSAQSLWAESSLSVNTWVPAQSSYQFIDTFLVSYEDQPLRGGCSDADYNDFRIALQFFNTNGTAAASIPEPSTWALILGSGALGFAFFRKTHCRTKQV